MIEAGLKEVIKAALDAAAQAPGEALLAPLPRWTLKRLVAWVEGQFARVCGCETLRRALHHLGLSWKKAKKLLGKADPERRAAFVEQIQELLNGALHADHLLVYVDEAHIHSDADLGYGWSVRGERFWVCSASPGLSEKVSCYGLYLYNEGQVEIWPYPRANSDSTLEVLERLRARCPMQPIKLVWDGASYHRSLRVRQRAAELDIELIPLPGYRPDFMPVEARWHWLREEVTYHHCHASTQELIDHIDRFRQRINAKSYTLADRRWVKDHLNLKEEKLRISK